MSKTIHYTEGYGGSLNYLTICGKEIHSHSETEDAEIDPTAVTCEKCRSTDKWIEDEGHHTGTTETNKKRRIFIESDILSAQDLQLAQDEVESLCDDFGVGFIPRIFSEVLDRAWHDLPKTWGSVVRADEIYASTSLMPIISNHYSGSPVIFDGMCERAIKESVTGKAVYILNKISRIKWGMIDVELMKKAFANNDLFMYDEAGNMVKVDVSTIKEK